MDPGADAVRLQAALQHGVPPGTRTTYRCQTCSLPGSVAGADTGSVGQQLS